MILVVVGAVGVTYEELPIFFDAVLPVISLLVAMAGHCSCSEAEVGLVALVKDVFVPVEGYNWVALMVL
jgi:hypothetical protein